MSVGSEEEAWQRDFSRRLFEKLDSLERFPTDLDDVVKSIEVEEDQDWLAGLTEYLDTQAILTYEWYGSGPPGWEATLELVSGPGTEGYLMDAGDPSADVHGIVFARIVDRTNRDQVLTAVKRVVGGDDFNGWPQGGIPTGIRTGSGGLIDRQNLKDALMSHFTAMQWWTEVAALAGLHADTDRDSIVEAFLAQVYDR